MPKKLTKEEFIKKANKVHESKYNYDNVDDVNSRTKVCIICPKHGEFWQEANSHLRGQGCPKCKCDEVRKSKEDFIKKSNEVHNGKYNYDKVDYKNAHTKVSIICKDHGEFWQSPSNHIQGAGCPKCANEGLAERYRLSKDEFIKKAKEKHGNKYDYSKVNYVDNKTKVCIICHEHGKFWQQAGSHLQGVGCPKCANEATGERCRSSKEEFIKKANEVHEGKYDYSNVDYVNSKTKVCIICPEHGEFKQIPNSHLNGNGCPKCSSVYVPTTEEWIVSARKVHGDKYDYSKVKYINANTKVCIICPEHGEFKQRPSVHLSDKGCPKCNLSHLERSVKHYLDDIGITYDYQKHFDWLGLQSLDFYLPDYNVGIECQGEQHFFPVDFAGEGVEWACKEFDKTVSRDKKKKKLCEKHGVKLLYFGNVPNYNTFLGEDVHDDVQYLIDYLEEHKKENT